MADPSGKVHLVRMAIVSNYTGDAEWVDTKTELRVGRDPANRNLTPPAIMELARNHVAAGGDIFCKAETGIWKNKRDFVYWVVIPVPGFPKGLFVEYELYDDDPNDPRVWLLNAHPSAL